MYSYELRKSVEKIFFKLTKKNPKQLLIIENKIQEIRKNPQHYKNLRKPLQHLKRIHIDKSFVLVFSVDENNKHIIIEDYEHHDKCIFKIIFKAARNQLNITRIYSITYNNPDLFYTMRHSGI